MLHASETVLREVVYGVGMTLRHSGTFVAEGSTISAFSALRTPHSPQYPRAVAEAPSALGSRSK